MHRSLGRIAELPEDTRLYPAHEYTLSNARYAAHAEPDNEAIAERLEKVARLRDAGEITLPTSVAEERATNPFVRAGNVAELARLRAEKDMFRS
jgi:hydroxyacylglutathione hydrolase